MPSMVGGAVEGDGEFEAMSAHEAKFAETTSQFTTFQNAAM
jgi:hypothetical protein